MGSRLYQVVCGVGGKFTHPGFRGDRVPDLVSFGVEVRAGGRHRGVVRHDNRSFLCDCGMRDGKSGLRGHVFEIMEGDPIIVTHERGDRRTYTPSWH